MLTEPNCKIVSNMVGNIYQFKDGFKSLYEITEQPFVYSYYYDKAIHIDLCENNFAIINYAFWQQSIVFEILVCGFELYGWIYTDCDMDYIQYVFIRKN
jgi:hypothetical protein